MPLNMSVTELTSTNLVKKFKVELDEKKYASAKTEILNEVRSKVTVPGFRPGKAPDHLLEQQHGAAIKQDVLTKLVQEENEAIIKQNNFKLALAPRIIESNFNDSKAGKYHYELELELLPTFDVPEFSKVKLKRWVVTPNEDDINEVINNMRMSHAEFTEAKADTKAKTTDRLSIDFVGTIDGEEFEGNRATDFPVVIGSGGLIPGFETQLEGKKAGDNTTVKVTFPASYPAKKLAGKDAEFEVTVKKIEHSKPAELNEAFFEKYKVENLDQLKEKVVSIIKSFEEEHGQVELRKALFDVLDEQLEAELPPTLVEDQYHQIHHMEHHDRGENHEHTDEEEKELRKLADRRVKLGLFLMQLAEAEKMEITQEDLNAEFSKELQNFPGIDPQVLMQYYSNRPEMMEEMKGRIIENKMVQFILGKVAFEDQPISFADFRKHVETSAQ